MNRYPLRLIAPAIGVAMIVGTYSLVRPPAPRVAAHPAPTGHRASPLAPFVEHRDRAGLVALVRALQPRVPSGPVPTPAPTFGPPPIPTGQPAGLSLAQVYQRVQQAISRPGLLYKATIQVSQHVGQGRTMGPFSYRAVIKQWVDARRNVAREEEVVISATGKPLTQTRETTITTAQGRYIHEPGSQVFWTSPGAATYPGATLAASAVLSTFGFPTYTGQSTTVVQQGRLQALTDLPRP
jgi:hypothetical protein